MRIYLDNCCFNRPFDDQSQLRIRLEAEAKLAIQEKIFLQELELVWSFVIDYENEMNPFQERSEYISTWKTRASIDIEETGDILRLAEELLDLGLRGKDTLHVASAVEGRCDYFITTDDDILRKMKKFNRICVVNPVEFITGGLI